jgi:hypothetical protein
MSSAPADFYMGSTESTLLERPRRCWRVKRLTTPNRKDDLLVVRVAPPISGAPYELANDMDSVIVASRLGGDSLFPINTFPKAPIPVYVGRPLVDWRDRTNLNPDELKLLDWAELYPSEAEALAKMTYAEVRKYGKRI